MKKEFVGLIRIGNSFLALKTLDKCFNALFGKALIGNDYIMYLVTEDMH
jgi:hypothetical protein